MKLEEVEIFEFKSIIKERIVIPSNQLCLVGKNESGKSSIIQAISCLDILGDNFTSKLLNKASLKYPDGMPVISGIFKLEKQEYSKILEVLSGLISNSILLELPSESDDSWMQIKRWGIGIFNISVDLTDKNTYKLKLSDKIKEKAKFYTLLYDETYPIIEYFEREELLIEPATSKDLLGNNKKFETFRRLLKIGGCDDFNRLKTDDSSFLSTLISKIESNLNRIFEKHYKQDKSIKIKLQTVSGDKLCLIIQDGTGESFLINERSPGFQYYFSFLTNKLYSQSVNEGKIQSSYWMNQEIIFILKEQKIY